MEPDGNLKWSFEIGTEIVPACPALASNGRIILKYDTDIYGIHTSNRGYEPEASWPAFTFSPQRSIIADDVTMPPMYTVRGQVTMPNSTPLQNIPVSINGLVTTTDEHGYYTCSLPDGEYTVTLLIDSTMIPKTTEVTVNGSDVAVPPPTIKLHTVQGYVMDRNGPMSNVTVLLGSELSITDENGMYSFTLADGEYALEFSTDDSFFPLMKHIVVNGEDMTVDDMCLHHEAWRQTFHDNSKSTPLPGPDGTLYFIETMIRDSTIRLLDSNGVTQREYKINERLSATPAQADDGTLYYAKHEWITALTPDLTHKWTFTVPELGAGRTPAVGKDGTIYFGATEKIYALNPDGTVRWEYEVGGGLRIPVIAVDGTVYFACNDGKLYAFEPDGTVKWIRDMACYSLQLPVIGVDGTLYFGGSENKFYAVNPDGTLKWTVETGSASAYPAVLDRNGTIYFTSSGNRLYAINSNGKVKWSYLLDLFISELFYYEPGNEIWISNNTETFAFNPDGTIKWRHAQPLKYPVMDESGRIYACEYPFTYNREMYLHAFDMAELPVSVEDGFSDDALGMDGKPSMITLHQNYPNPFNPETTITFTLRADTEVTVDVYSIAGQHVARLADKRMAAGPHRLKWDGLRFAAGVYLARISAGGEIGMHKMLLLK